MRSLALFVGLAQAPLFKIRSYQCIRLTRSIAMITGPGILRRVRYHACPYRIQLYVAPNTKPDGSDDAEGRQKNRWVEIVMRKKG